MSIIVIRPPYDPNAGPTKANAEHERHRQELYGVPEASKATSGADPVATAAPPALSRELASMPPEGTDTRPVYLAMYWLRRQLENGPVAVKTVEAMAVKEGFSERTLRRARDRLNLKPVRKDWRWYLAADSCHDQERLELKRLKKEAGVKRRKELKAVIKREKEFRRAAKLFNIPLK